MAAWDPLAAEAAGTPGEGARLSGGRFTVVASGRESMKLAGPRPSLAYLAGTLRSDRARRIHIAVGSDDGIEVRLAGRTVLRREAQRAGASDLDLISVDLHAGDTPLLIRAWRRRPGRFRLWIRLSDRNHRRPRGLRVVLPGAGGAGRHVLGRSATLGLDREVDLSRGVAVIDGWLSFPGGSPAGPGRTARVTVTGRGAPPAGEIDIDDSPEADAFFHLARFEVGGDARPSAVSVDFAGRRLEARVGVSARDLGTLAGAAADLARVPPDSSLQRTSVESVAWRIEHLKTLIEEGDGDRRYLERELGETRRRAAALARGEDPYAGERGGFQRRGYRSAVDGKLHPYALYVPPGWKEDGSGRFGLVVALHGLRGEPMSVLQALLGIPLVEGEDRGRRARHPQAPKSAPMFAVAPEGFGASSYRAFGERDVLEVVDRVRERYRIDPDRIYITGPSMGGTGSAGVPLRNPGLFAAAAPLCGYHSLELYRSLQGVTLAPWEKLLTEQRSNARWADHGRHLPLYVVHGTRDNPRTSAVLVEAYRERGFDVAFETPDLGHNVWEETYRDRRIFEHFRPIRREAHPRRVTLHTPSLRHARAHWLGVERVPDPAAWSRLDATWGEDGRIDITTVNTAEFFVERDEELAAGGEPIFTVDGDPVMARAGVDGRYRFHRGDGEWVGGPSPSCPGACKRAGAPTGPIGDALHEPLLFVYGTGEADETALARRVIDGLRRPGPWLTVDWPVEADVEVSDEDIATHSLVIVGTEAGNRLLARIAPSLPIRSGPGWVSVGERRFEGPHVAAAFVFPNPLNPERTVVVHTGASSDALFFANHLPDLLPDWIVYDASSWERAGGLVLGGRPALAGGFFDADWRPDMW